MSERPTLEQVLTAVKDVTTEWHELGIYLGLSDSDLKLIGSHQNIEGHLRMMLSKWLDYDPQARWDKLAKALNTMGKNAIAANIRSKYVGTVATALHTVDTSDNDSDDSKTRMFISLII